MKKLSEYISEGLSDNKQEIDETVAVVETEEVKDDEKVAETKEENDKVDEAVAGDIAKEEEVDESVKRKFN